MDSNSSTIPCIIALLASHTTFYPADICPDQDTLPLSGLHFFCTVRADFAKQSLGHQSHHRVGHQIRLNTHIFQTDDTGYGIVGVQCGQYYMTGDCRTDRCRCCLSVPGLAYHDNIRILAHQCSKPNIKGQSRHRIHLGLVDARKILFYRVFDGGNVHISPGQIFQNHIQCRRLSTSCGAGDIYDPIWCVQHWRKLLITEVIHAKLTGMIHFSCRSQDTKYRFFSKYRR